MPLWRVMWEADVEADNPVAACVAARDAFSVNQDCGSWHVLQFIGDDLGPVIEVHRPLAGPHPHVLLTKVRAPVALKP